MLTIFCLQSREGERAIDRIDSPLARNVCFKASLGNNFPRAELMFVQRFFEVAHQEEVMEA